MPLNKKRWAVRAWSPMGDPKNEAVLLEDTLNTLDDEGYDVRDINWERSLIVAYAKPEPESSALEIAPLDQLPTPIRALVDRMQERLETLKPPEEEEEASTAEAGAEGAQPEPKGARTRHFLNGLMYGLELSSRGADNRALEQHVERLVQHTFRGCPTEEARNTMLDIKECSDEHSKNTVCEGDCCTKKMLLLGIAQLEKHLEAHPAN